MAAPIRPNAAPTEQMRELTADPKEMRRMSAEPGAHTGIAQRAWGFQARLDSNVTFEEYSYWAKVERELEKEEFIRYKSLNNKGAASGIKALFSKNPYQDNKTPAEPSSAITPANDPNDPNDEKNQIATVDSDAPDMIKPGHSDDLNAEWRQASRALRTGKPTNGQRGALGGPSTAQVSDTEMGLEISETSI